MDYQQAIDYLYSFPDSEAKLPRTPAEFNLPQTAALLRMFGEPQRALRCVVVAGTKGKGSTATLIEAIARAAGLRTGLWTSPHLHSWRERIQVDRQRITQAEFIQAMHELPARLAGFDHQAHGDPTIFQLGFALALRHFADKQVDLAILEVGLGGRFDSANVITPLLSVITSISYDHMGILGHTLAAIASEKAGILKPGVPGITVQQYPEAMQVIVDTAARVGTPLYIVADRQPTTDDRLGAESTPDHPWSAVGGGSSVVDPYAIYRGPHDTALKGRFQRENARLATGAALLLREAGLPLNDAAIAEGLATASWPGRMELLPGAPTIVLDGAHNGDSAHKLAESLAEAYPGQPVVYVLGVTQGHSAEHILSELVPRAHAVVLTRATHPRAISDLAGLAELARPMLAPGAALVCEPSVPAALERARELAGAHALVCVSGSLFVVALAREALGISEEKD